MDGVGCVLRRHRRRHRHRHRHHQPPALSSSAPSSSSTSLSLPSLIISSHKIHLQSNFQFFRSRHLIHRDIKPANFVTGGAGGSANCIYCIDFGLSKRYRHPRTLQHIPQREGRSLTGTPRYASINNHLGVEQSRRDDLESIGYVLIYFLRGGLPWQGLKAKSASKKYKLIMEKKQNVTITALCSGCPSQVNIYGEKDCRWMGEYKRISPSSDLYTHTTHRHTAHHTQIFAVS